MTKTTRGLKAAATLLSLLLTGVVVDAGSLYGQSQTTQRAVPAVMEHGASVMEQAYAMVDQGSVVTEQGSACSSCSAPTAFAYAQPTPAYTAPVASCGCDSGCQSGCKSGCKLGCKRCSKKKACTDCDCQFCELEVKKGEVEKSSYKIEQKEVCIPAVRLPWKKNCPPKRSRVRTVNVLKKVKHKSPKCEYKWSVHEPEEYKEPELAEPVVAYQAEQSATEGVISYPDPAAETTGVLELSDPAAALEGVPRPPIEK